LSPFLEKVFGIPPSKIFSGAEVILPSYSSIDFGLTPQFHVIMCDLADPQYFKGKKLPVLKTIPFTDTIGSVHEKCNPITYIPILSQSLFGNIKLWMVDENLDFTRLKSDSQTTVVLHIRSRF
jgi:hypothetical protein